MNVYLDLDGTILDVWQRYYHVTKDFLAEKGVKSLSFAQYRACKMEFEDDLLVLKNLLDCPEHWISEFKQFKNEHMETEKYLSMDKELGDLRAFQKQVPEVNLVLVTMRKSEKLLYWELERLGIGDVFHQIVLADQQAKGNPKAAAIRHIARPEESMIGDSMIDIQCGIELGIKSVFVLSGMTKKERMDSVKKEHPLTILESVSQWRPNL